MDASHLGAAGDGPGLTHLRLGKDVGEASSAVVDEETQVAERTVGREQVLRHRFRRQQLDRAPGAGRKVTSIDLLDIGVQDTGADGAGWALVLRGAPLESLSASSDELALAWTLRGAPHAYRRADLAEVAVATAPWSDDDAAKRIFDASTRLRKTDREILDALREVADAERELARKPIVKGDLSHALNSHLGEEFLRWCNPCQATHIYEQPFRLSALQAGLELEPGTSPPVLKRAPKLRPNLYRHLAGEAPERHQVVRGTLRFFGPLTVKEVTEFLDAAQKDVKAHWPDDVVEVEVSGVAGTRFLLADDLDDLDAAADAPAAAGVVVRLVGSHDAFLQARDRAVLVPNAAHRKALLPVIGRPGGVVADGQLVGLWRPKTSGRRFTLRLTPWGRMTKARRAAVEVEAERLAAFRGLELAGITDER